MQARPSPRLATPTSYWNGLVAQPIDARRLLGKEQRGRRRPTGPARRAGRGTDSGAAGRSRSSVRPARGSRQIDNAGASERRRPQQRNRNGISDKPLTVIATPPRQSLPVNLCTGISLALILGDRRFSSMASSSSIRPFDHLEPHRPEIRIGRIEAERGEQLLVVLGAACREHVEIAVGEALLGLLVDGIERVHQAIAEGIGIDVERRVDEVRDVAPEGLVAGLEVDGRARGSRAAPRARSRRAARW